jgi:hypothetical protein
METIRLHTPHKNLILVYFLVTNHILEIVVKIFVEMYTLNICAKTLKNIKIIDTHAYLMQVHTLIYGGILFSYFNFSHI